MIEVLLLSQVAATLVMVGVIWFVQIVHYPLMARVPASEFTAFEREHQNRTTVVVAPTMLVEAFSAAVLLAVPLPGTDPIFPAVGISLLAVIWLSTVLVQVPLHARLEKGFDTKTHRLLVLSNWLRTIAWTGRGILSLLMLQPT
jgi:hypothetical protein